jgi:hypothetical protein
VRAALATLAFVATLLLVYYVHMRQFRVNVVLHASILDAVIAVVVVFAGLYALKWFRDFSRLELIQLAAIWLLGGYVFAISVPTVIDRSLSFYILGFATAWWRHPRGCLPAGLHRSTSPEHHPGGSAPDRAAAGLEPCRSMMVVCG